MKFLFTEATKAGDLIINNGPVGWITGLLAFAVDTAVKQALATRYQIDAAKLTAAGFGATRPKEPNDTPEGRARNRRVELVRQ